ncbi:MAG: peptidylprolyl isomerase [Pseudomonadota bacterium]
MTEAVGPVVALEGLRARLGPSQGRRDPIEPHTSHLATLSNVSFGFDNGQGYAFAKDYLPDEKGELVRFFLSVAAIAAAGVVSLMTPPAVADEAKVIAKVDGQVITEQDLVLAEQEIGGQLRQMPPAQRRRVLVEFLIENQLVAKAAGTSDLQSSSDFKARMDYWKRRSLRDSYFEANIEASVDDATVKAFYDKEVASRSTGEEIRASHILVKSEDKAKELFEAIAHDGDFAELAKKHSIDPGSGANGGDLGFFGKGRMVPAFEKAAFALKDGEVSEPVKSRFGWHIIKLTERRQTKAPPLAQLKDRIRMVLIRRRATKIVDDFRKKAKIEYVDPAVKAMVEGEGAKKK